jgi:1,4-dihydroxy-2-naphthoate polyprenyltransferase
MAARLTVWAEAARPKTLPAAIIPVLVGTAFAAASGEHDLLRATICLVFALLVQVGTNFANDYFDFLQGADTAERVGPRRAVAAGLVTPAAMLRATVLVLAIAFAAGLLLVREAGWILLPVGIVSIVCAVAYTGGPYPLGYNGLGDLFVFIFFGLVAVGVAFFVQAGPPTAEVWLAGGAIGLLAQIFSSRTTIAMWRQTLALESARWSCGSGAASPAGNTAYQPRRRWRFRWFSLDAVTAGLCSRHCYWRRGL